MEVLAEILRRKNFREFYEILPGIIDELYENADMDLIRLIKIFTYLGQSFWIQETYMTIIKI